CIHAYSRHDPRAHIARSTLSLHDALPISSTMPNTTGIVVSPALVYETPTTFTMNSDKKMIEARKPPPRMKAARLPMLKTLLLNRSEEHTSELQSLAYLVCRLLLEKKRSKA